MSDSKDRFTQTVDYYDQYRPGYPQEIITLLKQNCGLEAHDIIVDIGSGTGKLSHLFLLNENTVYAVEPNDAMRAVAEKLFNRHKHFISVKGSAEKTTLTDHLADFVIAAQAFHWFDPIASKSEFKRVLKPSGWVVLIWNLRQIITPFMHAYENLLQTFGIQYQEMKAERIHDQMIMDWFAPKPVYKYKTEFQQCFDREGLKGRLESTSYVPKMGSNYIAMMKELNRLFDLYQKDDRVTMSYSTEVYYGQI